MEDNSIVNIYCPSCGAPAEFDIVHQLYRCRYCGGTVELEDARLEKAQTREILKQKAKSSVGNYPLMTTVCTGCGATLVFEENEAVSSCDFCGRKLVRKKYHSSADEPEAIIPFAVTAEEAKEKLVKWCEENKHRSEAKYLMEQIDSLKGYYLPYRMARGPVYCDVNKKGDSQIFHGRGYLENAFVNCSHQLDNLVLDAMEPYDLSELKPFDYSYVAGQRVKITDITTEHAYMRLEEETSSNYRVFMEKIWGSKAIQIDTTVETVLDVPALLPVYYLNTGAVSAAVNGQTGKISVRKGKESIYLSLPWWLEALLLFAAACALVFGIGVLAYHNYREPLFFTGIVGGFYLFIFCFMFEPGLNNTFEIIRYRDILTSGEQTYRREKGRLIPRDEVLKRRIAEPVFVHKLKGKDVQVTYIFRSLIRIASMVALSLAAVFLPVILALFVNGFDFGRICLGGSAVWFCITVPTAPIILIQLGLKELYHNPWIYTISEDGTKKRYHEGERKPLDVILTTLKVLLGICIHPLGWIILGSMAVMVYLTAFGF